MRFMIAVKSLTAPFILLALFVPGAAAQADKTAVYPASQTEEVTTVESDSEEAPAESTTAAAEQDFVPQQEISEDYPIALPADI